MWSGKQGFVIKLSEAPKAVSYCAIRVKLEEPNYEVITLQSSLHRPACHHQQQQPLLIRGRTCQYGTGRI